MSRDLLTDDDLVELTGQTQPAAQLRLLQRHGLRPIVRADGRPRVTWAAITAAIAGAGLQAHTPNFAALHAGQERR